MNDTPEGDRRISTHAPVRARLAERATRAPAEGISTHAPVRARQDMNDTPEGDRRISTHAPVRARLLLS